MSECRARMPRLVARVIEGALRITARGAIPHGLADVEAAPQGVTASHLRHIEQTLQVRRLVSLALDVPRQLLVAVGVDPGYQAFSCGLAGLIQVGRQAEL